MNTIVEDIIIRENLNCPKPMCEVCLEEDSIEGNEVIVCGICYIAVHIYCYGEPLRSSLLGNGEQWHCQRCQECMKNEIHPNTIICRYCKQSKGALKYVNIRVTKDLDFIEDWVHIFCVNWIPEIYFENEDEKVLVDEIWDHRRLSKRKKLVERKTCGVCSQAVGYLINCERKSKELNCSELFHPTCAKEIGCIFSSQIMRICLFDEKQKYEYVRVYCKDHLQEYLQKNKKALNKKAETEFPADFFEQFKNAGESTKPVMMSKKKLKKKVASPKSKVASPKNKVASPISKADACVKKNKPKGSYKKRKTTSIKKKPPPLKTAAKIKSPVISQSILSNISPIPIVQNSDIDTEEEEKEDSWNKSSTFSEELNYKYKLTSMQTKLMDSNSYKNYNGINEYGIGASESESSSFNSDWSDSDQNILGLTKKRRLNPHEKSIDNSINYEMSLYPPSIANQKTLLRNDDDHHFNSNSIEIEKSDHVSPITREYDISLKEVISSPYCDINSPVEETPIEVENNNVGSIYNFKQLATAFAPGHIIYFLDEPSGSYIEPPQIYRGKELIILDDPFKRDTDNGKVRILKVSKFVEPRDKTFYKNYFNFINYKFLSQGCYNEFSDSQTGAFKCKNESAFLDLEDENTLSNCVFEDENNDCRAEDDKINKEFEDLQPKNRNFIEYNQKWNFEDIEDLWK